MRTRKAVITPSLVRNINTVLVTTKNTVIDTNDEINISSLPSHESKLWLLRNRVIDYLYNNFKILGASGNAWELSISIFDDYLRNHVTTNVTTNVTTCDNNNMLFSLSCESSCEPSSGPSCELPSAESGSLSQSLSKLSMPITLDDNNMYLTGIVCLLIASKYYDEIDWCNVDDCLELHIPNSNGTCDVNIIHNNNGNDDNDDDSVNHIDGNSNLTGIKWTRSEILSKEISVLFGIGFNFVKHKPCYHYLKIGNYSTLYRSLRRLLIHITYMSSLFTHVPSSKIVTIINKLIQRKKIKKRHSPCANLLVKLFLEVCSSSCFFYPQYSSTSSTLPTNNNINNGGKFTCITDYHRDILSTDILIKFQAYIAIRFKRERDTPRINDV